MKSVSIIKKAAFTTLAALGLFTGSAFAGVNVGVDIQIGGHAPPPPVVVVERPVVIVEQRPAIVVVQDPYLVGFRTNLYDADARLRIAQAEQYRSSIDLDAARRHEGEIAVALEEQEHITSDLRHEVGTADLSLEAAHAACAKAADEAAGLRTRLEAFEKRIGSAKSDLDSATTLRDRPGIEDAAARLRTSQESAAATAADLHIAEERFASAHAAEQHAAAAEASRASLHEAEAQVAHLRADFEAAHESVFAAQSRLTASNEAVCLALHDRDESLWLLHRDEIVAGRCDFGTCGFHIDLAVWGGHMPRDPEVIHAYFVHDVTYWRARPVEIQTRVIEVDRVTEVTRIREVARVREPDRIKVAVDFEVNVKIEDRRKVAEHVVVERERFVVEQTERKQAASEGRKPKVTYVDKTNVNTENVKNMTTVKNVTNVTNVKNVTNVTNVSKTDPKQVQAENNLAKAENNLAKSNAKLADANKDLAKDNSKLANSNKKLAKEDDKLADSNKKLATADTKLAKDDSKLADSNKKLATADTKLAKDDSKLADSNKKLAKDDSKLADSNKKLAKEDSKLADSNKKLAKDDSKLADSNKKLAKEEKAVASDKKKPSVDDKKIASTDPRASVQDQRNDRVPAEDSRHRATAPEGREPSAQALKDKKARNADVASTEDRSSR